MTESRSTRRRLRILSIVGFLALAGSVTAQNASEVSQAPLSISWRVVDNYQNGPANFRSELVFANEGPFEFKPAGWAIYFNFIRRIRPESVPDIVTIRRLNGDFYELRPTHRFPIILPGDSVRIGFDASNWVIRSSDAPNGFYLVMDEDPNPTSLGPTEVGSFDSPEQFNRRRGDTLPLVTPSKRFIDNKVIRTLESGEFSPLIPSPAHLELAEDSNPLVVTTTVRIFAQDGLETEVRQLAELLDSNFGLTAQKADSKSEADVILSLDPSTSDTVCSGSGSYRLSIDSGTGAEIVGFDQSGVFYGIQSLVGLVDPESIRSGSSRIEFPAVEIVDCPRFQYRGLMIDVARHFQSLGTLKKTIEMMSFYKLNRLHLHLADDEGWRLPVTSLPELTRVGSRRGHTLDSASHLPPSFGSGPDPGTSPGSGHYSRSEFIELLRFADERHVEVIPEIDMPGHARAAIVSMEHRYRRLAAMGDSAEAGAYRLVDPLDTSEYVSIQGWNDNVINVCIPSTYRFLAVIVDELVGMYNEAGVSLSTLHFGGDEVPEGVWEQSPACEHLFASEPAERLADHANLFFFGQLAEILRGHGLNIAGWDEIAEALPPDTTSAYPSITVIPYVWNTVWGWGGEERPYRLANEGYPIVMSNSPSLYFDLAYEKDPDEPGFAWAGFVNDRTVFEFTPLDIYLGAIVDRMGNPLPEGAYKNAVRLTEAGKNGILGIQGQLWGERTPDVRLFEYQLYPKMLALAERAWSPRPEWAAAEDRADVQNLVEEDWNRFANTLGQREFVRLRRIAQPVGFRIPPAGVSVADGYVRANTAYPGLEIRFTADGSEPTLTSARYSEPIPETEGVKLRVFDSSGRGSRTVRPR